MQASILWAQPEYSYPSPTAGKEPMFWFSLTLCKDMEMGDDLHESDVPWIV